MIAVSRFTISFVFFILIVINSFNAKISKISENPIDICIPFADVADCQSSVSFNITLGISTTWQPLLLLRTSAQFRELAPGIEEAVVLLFRNANIPGTQNAHVLSFWKGSLMVNLSLINAGHAIRTSTLFTKLNSALRGFVARRNNSFMGHQILANKWNIYYPEYSNRQIFRSHQNRQKLLLMDGGTVYNLAGSDVVSKSDAQETAAPKSKGFLKQPVMLGIVIAAAVALVILIILCILYCLYRARKADEGSYALNNKPKMVPLVSGKTQQRSNAREFFA